MLAITSTTNSQVKETVRLHQKKYRNEKNLYLIEGHKPIFEAFHAGAQIETVYVTKENVEKFSFLKDKLTIVSDAVMEKISTTDSAPEAVAVAKQFKFKLDDIKKYTKIALIENIKDAGNLGTIIRSAAAFGIEAVILSGDTIDLFNPKVVRSAVGALFKLPIVNAPVGEVSQVFKSHNLIATVVNHKDIVDPTSIDYGKPFVIMLGSEADGLTQEAICASTTKTTIPISANTESLNLSVAGSIMFYISNRAV